MHPEIDGSPPAISFTATRPPSARGLGLFGLGLPDLLRARAANPPRAPARQGVHRAVHVGRAGPAGHLGPEARRPGRVPRRVQADRDDRPRPADLRTPAAAGAAGTPARLIRSMTHDDVNHTDRDALPAHRQAGTAPARSPTTGRATARCSRSWAAGAGRLPPFVSMMPVVPDGAPRFVEESHGQGAGCSARSTTRCGSTPTPRSRTTASASSRLAPSSTPRRARDRQAPAALARRQAHAPRATMPMPRRWHRTTTAPSRCSRRRRRRGRSTCRSEPLRVRERYGMNIHGQSVLQARRLVEAGVPLVTVFWPNDGITNVSVYWDTHNRNFIDLKTRLCPVTDQAFSALLDDLEERGMLDETLVVWTGEMGRTPRVGQSVVGGAGAGTRRPRPLGQGVHDRAGRRRREGRRGPRLQRPLRRRPGDEPDAAGRPGRDGLPPARRRSAPGDPRPARPADDAVRGEGDRGDSVGEQGRQGRQLLGSGVGGLAVEISTARLPRLPTFGGRDLAPLLVRNCTARLPTIGSRLKGYHQP